MIHIFHGEDDFSQAEALADLKNGLGPSEALASNTSIFEAARATPEAVLLACSALPFLSEHRLVVLEGALITAEAPRGRRQEKTAWGDLVQAAPQLPPTTSLVLRDGKLRPDNPLLKALSPYSQVREFPPLRGGMLQRWAQDRSSRHGARLEPDAARLLADLIGANLWALSCEIDKLSTYAAPAAGGQGAITVADVQALTSQAREASIFALVDALVEGRRATALTLLHRAVADGVNSQYIFTMVARQLHILVQAQDLLQSGAAQEEIGRTLGLNPGFPLRKALEQARGSSFLRLRDLYRLALEADAATKTGRLSEETALDILFAAGTTR